MEKVFLFATNMSPLGMPFNEFEKAVEKTKDLPGMIAVHPDVTYALIIFDTLENAITSRGIWTEAGYEAARYIMNGRIEDDWQTITVDDPAFDCQGGPLQ